MVKKVILEDGSSFRAPHIILATQAIGLVKEYASIKTNHQSTTHLHFVAQDDPIGKPVIALNTSEKRLANNICTISNVRKCYAPKGRICFLFLWLVILEWKEKHYNRQSKRAQTWFGKSSLDWEHLHTRKIEYALPNQQNVLHQAPENQYTLRDGLYACGDFQMNGSINAAMMTGRKVAEIVGRNLGSIKQKHFAMMNIKLRSRVARDMTWLIACLMKHCFNTYCLLALS